MMMDVDDNYNDNDDVNNDVVEFMKCEGCSKDEFCGGAPDSQCRFG